MSALEPQQIVNLKRYPIADSESEPCIELASRIKSDMDAQQYCVLPNFMTDVAIEVSVVEAAALKSQGYANSSDRNCYLHQVGDPALPENHPRNTFFHASYTMMARDLFPDTSPIIQMYYWQPVIDFVAAVVGMPRLYVNADPFQPANILAYGTGNQSAWHFDSGNAFTMTLMLQSAHSGGDFEIAPNVRTDTDPCFDEVAKVLDGDRSRVISVPRQAGALVIFRGCNSLHRVTPVTASKDRLMSVFVYETAPGVVGDPEVNATVYGRRTQTAP